MNRRDFLHPTQLAQTAGQALGLIDDHAAPAADSDVALLRVGRRAMGTRFEILLPYNTSGGLSVAEAGLDLVDRLETQLTVYHDRSEVSRLNRRAGSRPVRVEDRLFDLLQLAVRLYQETEAAFDITSGPLVKCWGFFRRSGRVPSNEERVEVLKRVGSRHLELDEERRTVRFQQPGMEINLGSIGKGYALDRVAESIREDRQVSSGLLHGGRSSIYALGSLQGDQRGWPIGIRHPHLRDRYLATIRLRDQGLATSGAIFQHLEHEGKKLGHILDPRTGWPASGIASATVVAPTAAEADALATAFFILGIEKVREYCEAHPEVGALLLPDGVDAEAAVINLGPNCIELNPAASIQIPETRHEPPLTYDDEDDDDDF